MQLQTLIIITRDRVIQLRSYSSIEPTGNKNSATAHTFWVVFLAQPGWMGIQILVSCYISATRSGSYKKAKNVYTRKAK